MLALVKTWGSSSPKLSTQVTVNKMGKCWDEIKGE